MPSLKKLRLIEFECPKCSNVFEELIRDFEEKVYCPKCSSLSTPLKGAFYPTPKSSSWTVS